jgi:hypothetical protein
VGDIMTGCNLREALSVHPYRREADFWSIAQPWEPLQMTQPERSFVPARLPTKAVANRAPDNEFVSQEAHTGRVTTTIRMVRTICNAPQLAWS